MPKKISNDDVNLFRSSIGKIKLIKHDKISAPKRINKCYAIKLKSSNVIEVDNPRDFSTPISLVNLSAVKHYYHLSAQSRGTAQTV
jgi:hypothetical protein